MAFYNWYRKWPILCTDIQFRAPAHLLINRALLIVECKELVKLLLVGRQSSETMSARPRDQG